MSHADLWPTYKSALKSRYSWPPDLSLSPQYEFISVKKVGGGAEGRSPMRNSEASEAAE